MVTILMGIERRIGKTAIATIQPHQRTTSAQLEGSSINLIINIRIGQPVLIGGLHSSKFFNLETRSNIGRKEDVLLFMHHSKSGNQAAFVDDAVSSLSLRLVGFHGLIISIFGLSHEAVQDIGFDIHTK